MTSWVSPVRIALTRPESENDQLADRLREVGHDVAVCPLIAIEPLGDEPIDLAGYDWLVVTSANGVAEVARRGRGRPEHVAAVGTATAAALRNHGFEVSLVPARSTQEGLLAALPRPPGRVLLAAAEGARGLFVDETGADYVPLYTTRELRPEAFPDADLVVLASGSAARALARIRTDLPVVTIGPVTSETARAAGLEVRAEAETQDADGLARAVARAAAT
jgi:uroporphyrinogen-III synthase